MITRAMDWNAKIVSSIMSVIEYNDLLFKVSQRLNELNVGKRLLVMCRGKVAPRSEEHLPDALQLFWELQEKEYLGPDRLGVLKDVIGGLEEWSLLENVEKFETKRKEYHGLLEQIIQELELNDVEQLVSICKGKILDERQGNIRDVRSLFQELKNNSCLEINRLDILKEILRQTDKRDLLEKVKEFEERRNREHKSERRAGAYLSLLNRYSFFHYLSK